MTQFFRFPHTPHLTWLGTEQPRADKILSEARRDAMLANELVVEEKIDGANLGFSLTLDGDIQIQNRGQYLSPPFIGQFRKLSDWLLSNEDSLFDALGRNLIVFGEWCAARHSLQYTALPDWWILFDVYDKRTGRFFSTKKRNKLGKKAGVSIVHQVAKGKFEFNSLKDLLNEPSHYRQGTMEGIIFRCENASLLIKRAKLVRSEFTQAIDEHWSRRSIEWNQRIFPTYPSVPKTER